MSVCLCIILLQAVRPKLTLFKTIEEAAVAVDEMFQIAFQNAGRTSALTHLFTGVHFFHSRERRRQWRR